MRVDLDFTADKMGVVVVFNYVSESSEFTHHRLPISLSLSLNLLSIQNFQLSS